MLAVCDRIAKVRKMNGDRQEDLAQAIGFSRQTINYLESAKQNPTIDIVNRIAKHYGLTLSQFLEGIP